MSAGAGGPANVFGTVRAGFYHACRSLVAGPVAGLVGLRVFGAPDLRDLPGGLVLASNHQSFLDPALVALSLDTPIHYLARRGLFRVPGFAWMIRALNAHPVSRGQVDSSALRTVARLLRGGQKLLMFPEGTRTRDGRLGRFKAGAAALAVRCGTPILPLCIEGAFDSWPRHRLLPRPARAAVAFGQVIPAAGENAGELTGRVRTRIALLQVLLREFLNSVTGRGGLGDRKVTPDPADERTQLTGHMRRCRRGCRPRSDDAPQNHDSMG